MKPVHSILDRLTPEVEERFQARAGRAGDCWDWDGFLTTGYGRIKIRGSMFMAHRVAWVIANRRDVPDGLVLDHLCRNRACVNPDHLEPVTERENLLRGDTFNARQSAQTHCKRGHELAGDNLYAAALERGIRHCRTCNNDRKKAAA